VEIDEYCRRVLAKHWPAVQRFADIRDVGAHNLPYADILCGGFPCQDISNAGKRAGIDGERSGLWSEYARIIRELRPKYVVVENVAALLGRGVDRVLGDLAACGYDAEWQSIRASDVGAPHRRERIWIVAYSQRSGVREQSIFGTECSRASFSQFDSEVMAYPMRDRSQTGVADSSRGNEGYAGIVIHGSPSLAHANGGGFTVQREPSGCSGFATRGGETFPHAEAAEVRSRSGEIQSGAGQEISERSGNLRDDVSDAASGKQRSIGAQCDERRLQDEAVQCLGHSCDWATEPDVGRVAHGVPARVDRLRGLGNAIVPQIAEFIGHRIVADAFRSSPVTSHQSPVTAVRP
jgi:DNA (cytosine-5)-methyltransferase 1